MGTSNFRSMVEFDIYAWVYDYDNEDFKEYLRDCYPEYIDENGDIIENQGFYDLINANAHCEWEYISDELKLKMDSLNDNLIFHELEFVDGYYNGVQIFINEPYEYLWYAGNVGYDEFTDALIGIWMNKYGYDYESNGQKLEIKSRTGCNYIRIPIRGSA